MSARHTNHRSRGTSLLEALIALAVLTIGLLGVAQFHAVLRQLSDSTRQRAEAVRLAREDLEGTRGFADAGAYAAIGSSSRVLQVARTAFRIERSIATEEEAARKRVQVDIAWTDRRGRSESLVLTSAVDGTLPVYSGLLALTPPNAVDTPSADHPPLPWGALPAGDSARLSSPGRNLVLLFDLATGELRSACRPLANGQPPPTLEPQGCEAVTGPFAFGHVRFASSAPFTADGGNDPPLPLELELVPSADSVCSSEARRLVQIGEGVQSRLQMVGETASPEGLGLSGWRELARFTAYACWRKTASPAIAATELRIAPRGWTIGTAADQRHVCRHVVEAEAAPSRQHNFLVLPGPVPCPAGTQAHQP